MGGSRVPLGTAHLGIDVGTSNTAAALRGHNHEVRPVLFDGALLLPSAVFVDGGTTLVGLDARHAGASRPALLEPNPKRCVDDRFVLLGAQEVAVESLFAAILRRVRDAAEETAGRVTAVTLTYPATWGARRLATLTTAARLAGLPTPTTLHEPVSAAAHFVALPDVDLSPGQLALVYDLGAGTFDATLIRRTGDGFDVVASQGLADAGGLDIDAAVLASISAHLQPDDNAWGYLRRPVTPADRRNRQLLIDGVRAAKEMLSRASATSIYVPVLDVEVPLGREQFETLARPLLDRTVAAVRGVLRDTQVAESDLSAIFLVGGSTRIPLVGTLLHRALGRPPVVLDQPELAVAYGSVAGPDRPAQPPPPATWTRPASQDPPVAGALPAHQAPPASQVPPTEHVPPAEQALPTTRAVPTDEARSASHLATPVPTQPPSRLALRQSPWSARRRSAWSPRRRRWTAAGLGLILVAAGGLAYLIAQDQGRDPSTPTNASTPSQPASTDVPSSAAPGSAAPSFAVPNSAAAVVAPSPSVDKVAVVPATFVGQWTGTASQPSGVVKSWKVSISLPAGSDVGTFRSTTLGCRGTLTLVAPRPTEREIHLRQSTTSDPKSICVAAADWTLIADDGGRINMFWQEFGDPTNVSTATLTRP